MSDEVRPWAALWALCLGFFMILVDTTIVAVALPVLRTSLDTDIGSVMWVHSSYLLSYAVPLLITGRLGDRFGQKQVYLIGLVIFTLSSIWCGFAGGVAVLIVARVFQGFGAALMSPQTMAVITRVFPPERRGQAMGMWGAVAGAATLVGPLLGGVLVGSLGWEWIFFVNVPVGVVGFFLVWFFVPVLPRRSHRFDVIGVVLSGTGMFLLVFGIQEGQRYGWGTISGIVSVPLLITVGVFFLGVFVLWQARTRGEPLVPLRLFKDRNFSLANVAIITVGGAVTSMTIPLMLYLQSVLGLSPMGAAVLASPMAVLSGVLAPFVGRLVDRVHPRYIAGPGLFLLSSSMAWVGLALRPDISLWELLVPIALMGVASACVWSPLSVSATRNLTMDVAGAGAGVYNTTRQVGAVLGRGDGGPAAGPRGEFRGRAHRGHRRPTVAGVLAGRFLPCDGGGVVAARCGFGDRRGRSTVLRPPRTHGWAAPATRCRCFPGGHASFQQKDLTEPWDSSGVVLCY